MAILSGKPPGPYGFLSAIVARPGRSLAIKILPTLLFDPSEWPERFESETRVVAGQSHPRVYTRYDISHQHEADI